MSAYFVDTSALAKRYIQELGTEWVESWILPRYQNTIFISQIALVEFFSVLARRQRDKQLRVQQFNRLKINFLRHSRQGQYHIVLIDAPLLERARGLVVKHPLRTLDAIQLASALGVARALQTNPTFITGDQRLLAATAAEGLPIDNPYQHPH